MRPDMPSTTTFTEVSINGGANTQSPSAAGVEANLDVQYTTGMCSACRRTVVVEPQIGIATKIPVQFLSVGDSFATALLDTITFLDDVANPPTVMTTSYGSIEAAFLNSMATQICNGYMALGARGISVLFSSGDVRCLFIFQIPFLFTGIFWLLGRPAWDLGRRLRQRILRRLPSIVPLRHIRGLNTGF